MQQPVLAVYKDTVKGIRNEIIGK